VHWKRIFGWLVVSFFATASFAQESYRLEPSDQLELWTSMEPSLRRTATIQPDGWISLPLVGHVQAAGHTIPEFEKLLQERLKAYFKEPLDLTIMLQSNTTRPQTVYVAGDVTHPGSYAFRPGMLVIHSVTLAGGLYRPAAAAGGEDREMTMQRDIKLEEAQLAALSARVARINAEMEGGDPALATQASPADVARERNILEARRAQDAERQADRSQVESLRDSELKALEEQSKSIAERISLAERRLAQIASLVSRGFSNRAQQLEQEGDIASLKASEHELQARITQTRLNKSTDLARFEEGNKERRTALLLELREVQQEREAVQSRLADNKRILQVYMTGARTDTSRPTVSFSVVRMIDGKAVEQEVAELSDVQAGDLIRVRSSLPLGSGEPDSPNLATQSVQ